MSKVDDFDNAQFDLYELREHNKQLMARIAVLEAERAALDEVCEKYANRILAQESQLTAQREHIERLLAECAHS